MFNYYATVEWYHLILAVQTRQQRYMFRDDSSERRDLTLHECETSNCILLAAARPPHS